MASICRTNSCTSQGALTVARATRPQNRPRSPNHSKNVTNQFVAIPARLADTLDILPILIAFQGPNDKIPMLKNLAWRQLNVTCNSYKGVQLIASGGPWSGRLFVPLFYVPRLPWYEPLSGLPGCDLRGHDWLRSRVPVARARCEKRPGDLRV